jgi:hypothetical protein
MALINSLEKNDGGHFEIDLYWALMTNIPLVFTRNEHSLHVNGAAHVVQQVDWVEIDRAGESMVIHEDPFFVDVEGVPACASDLDVGLLDVS